MFCSKCGNRLWKGSAYCPRCGEKVKTLETMQLRCKKCDGILAVDEERRILSCPYCGSKELVLETDRVASQKIKSDAYQKVELGRQQVELKKIEYEMEKERKREEKEKAEAFKRGLLSKITLGLSVFCALMFVGVDGGLEYMPVKIITLAQAILFAASWLIGMNIVKFKGYDNHALLAALGFALFVPFFKLMP